MDFYRKPGLGSRLRVFGQSSHGPAGSNGDSRSMKLSARLEQQDQQIQQLQAQVSGMQQQGVNATPVSYAPGGGTAAAPAPAAPQPAEVGSDMSVTGQVL